MRPRSLALAALLPVALSFAACGGAQTDPQAGGSEANAGPEAAGFDLRDDPRIVELREACSTSGAYDRNLSDIVEVLIAKLDSGYGVALKRAREELGALGDRSMDALERRFRTDEKTPQGLPRLRSTMDAIALNRSDRATVMLYEALDHSDGGIRATAMRALEGRPITPELLEQMPGFYDRVYQAVAFNRLNTAADEGMGILQRIDPEQSAELFLQMLDVSGLTLQWNVALPLLGTNQQPEVLEKYRERVKTMGAPFAVFLHAALARSGDPDSQEFLQNALTGNDVYLRKRAMHGATAAGLWQLVENAAANDPDADGRLEALTLLAEQASRIDFEGDDRAGDAEVLERALDAVHRAHDDPAREVRDAALRIGMRLDDPVSIDLALQRLPGGQRRDLELVLPELRTRMRESEALAQRALTSLEPEWEALADRPIQDPVKLKFATAIGQIPLAGAAELLLDEGARSTGRIDSLRAHEWLAIQIASTGDAGRATVIERLAVETDPQRRLDLLFAIAADRDEFARQALFDHVDSTEDLNPWERLYAASLLANLGPAELAAPVIKRASARVNGEARAAFWCLLRIWY